MAGHVIESKVGCPKMVRVCTDFAICTVPYSPSLVFNLGCLGVLISATFPGNSPQDRDIMSSTSNKANKHIKLKENIALFFFILQPYCPFEISPIGNSSCWESWLRQSRTTQPMVHAGCSSVSMIHQTDMDCRIFNMSTDVNACGCT